ncbi:MAG: hypothetical protein JF567_01475 [Xanthomonadales bacterium]|nr:hypothetical protein [Xanthomonadales bacterium]
MKVTIKQLVQLGASSGNAVRYAGPLGEACVHYAITTPARLAMFLAQIFHESGRLRYAREIWGPTPAQRRYEGRVDLGNVHRGDGFRYRGRGLIQLTGRTNYAAIRDYLRRDLSDVPDFEADPRELELPQWAAYSAAAFWAAHDLNADADIGDFDAVTRTINPGMAGIVDRDRLWSKAKSLLGNGDYAAASSASSLRA